MTLTRLALVVTTGMSMLLGLAAPANAAAHQLTTGSGSSWASNAVEQWIADVHSVGLQVVYSPNGSAAGRQDFANRTVDFAVSDLPYQGTDPASGAVDTSQGRAFASVPLTAGGTAFPYHLVVDGQLLRTLRLSGASLAGIFTGSIRFWDDPRIQADNRHRLALPHLAITPVVHSEGSGTSYRLSRYLATEYPQQWGSATPSPYFPQPVGAQAEAGSDGVMNFISSGAGNGAIGYDEYSYALGKDYPVAAVQNRAGYFVLPNNGNVSVALRTAPDNAFDTGDFSAVYANPDARAYPLSSWSSAFIPTASDDARTTTAKRQTLADFLHYSLCQGQSEVAQIGYGALPLNLVQAGFRAISALKTADPGVDVSADDAEHCSGNPTFDPGPPAHDVLDSVAPATPACAGPTQGPCGVPADTITLSAPPSGTVSAGATHLEWTRAIDTVTGAALPGAPVTLWARRASSPDWAPVSSGSTGSDGIRGVTARPAVTTYYQYRFAGDPDHAAANSPLGIVRVLPRVTLSTTSRTPHRGSAVTLWGTVSPPVAGDVVVLQQLVRGRWIGVAHPVQRSQRDPDGRVRVSFEVATRYRSRGTLQLRVVSPGTADFVVAASPTVGVHVA